MAGIVVQSSLLGVVAIAAPVAASAADSLALGIFSDTRKTNPGKKNDHAPNRNKKSNGVRSLPNSFQNARIFPRKTTIPTTNENVGSENNLTQLYHSWMKLPQIIRFGVAGNLANLGFFFLEKIIFRLLTYLIVTSEAFYGVVLDGVEKYQDGVSFFTAYLVQIVTGHLLYAFLVYGMDTINTYEKYTKTLSGQFKVYGVGLFGATYLNSFLINSRGLDKTIAFWATTATFAVFNYFLVSWVVERAVQSSSPKGPARG